MNSKADEPKLLAELSIDNDGNIVYVVLSTGKPWSLSHEGKTVDINKQYIPYFDCMDNILWVGTHLQEDRTFIDESCEPVSIADFVKWVEELPFAEAVHQEDGSLCVAIYDGKVRE